MKKRVLFVVNTLCRDGVENSILPLLKAIDYDAYEVELYALLNCGDFMGDLPENVNIRNKKISNFEKPQLKKEVIKAGLRHGAFFSTLFYMGINLWRMMEKNHVLWDKLVERMVAKGGIRLKQSYDIAIAYGEGAPTYYVSDCVNATRKAAWIHAEMDPNGYNEYLDGNSYDKIHRIFAVSEEAKEAFLEVHPECMDKVGVFYNLIDPENIRRLAKSEAPEGYEKKGLRLLSVGRLNSQKAYDVAVQSMVYLRKWHYPIKWYVIGEGPLKKNLQELINQKKLTDDFILLGERENPYPYIANCDIYVHASRFEGKSSAIQEAQALGCAVIVSDVSDNKNQVANGYTGVVCNLNGKKLAEAIAELAEDPYIRRRMGNRNMEKDFGYSRKSMQQLFSEMEQ